MKFLRRGPPFGGIRAVCMHGGVNHSFGMVDCSFGDGSNKDHTGCIEEIEKKELKKQQQTGGIKGIVSDSNNIFLW